jgi:hypothetical protein
MIPGSANPLLLATAAGAAGGYAIERSLRFNSSDSAYLGRTPASAGNRKTWTLSLWAKRSKLGGSYQVLISNTDSSAINGLYCDFTSDYFQLAEYGASSFNWNLQSAAVYRDTSAWYHIVCAVDTTQATASDRVKIWINGERITSFYPGIEIYPTLNYDTLFNTTALTAIGRFGSYSTQYYYDGYLANVHFIDGQALDPTSFGALDANGIWQPKAYTGTYGTNGFHIPFSDNSTAAALGTDTSGNGNDWTPVNLVASSNSYIADTSMQVNGSTENSTRSQMWDGLKSTYAYAGSSNTSNFIKWQPSGGFVTSGYIWIQGGDGNGEGLDVSTVKINGSTVSHSSVVSNETYINAAYGWGKWWKYLVSGNTLTSLEVIGDFALIRQLSTVADPSFAALGISDDNDVPALTGALNSDVDSLVDVPTNGTETDTGAGGEVRGNYCTWNPLANYLTLTQGSLKASQASDGHHTTYGTIGVSSGKWYWEITKNDGLSSSDTSLGLGVAKSSFVEDGSIYVSSADTNNGYLQSGLGLRDGPNGLVGTVPSNTVPGGIHSAGTWMLAFDFDSGKGWLGKDGTWFSNTAAGNEGNPSTGANPCLTGFTSGETYVPLLGMYSASSVDANFGQRPFAYTAPSGFKALCTANLPSTTITTSGSYTGNGVADGPFVFLNGVPTAMTVNGNAVTFGTDADKLSNGFKIRTTSTTFNQNASTYNYTITTTGAPFKTARAQSN